MQDEEIRSRVELLPGRTAAAQQRRTEEIAHTRGYRLLAVHDLGFVGVRLDFERDDTPVARRRNELTIARLRAGGPVLTAVEPPAPPPPAPPQPATSPRGRRQPGRPPAMPQPSPPAAPARSRVPPPPPFPPLRPPPPPVAPPAQGVPSGAGVPSAGLALSYAYRRRRPQV
ncbi:hypothetical protein [Streptomyces xanthophaeus]